MWSDFLLFFRNSDIDWLPNQGGFCCENNRYVCICIYINTCWVHTFYVIYLYINIYIYSESKYIYIYRIVLDVSSSRDTILTTRLTLHPFSLTLTIPIKTSSKHPLSTIPGRYILRCIQDDGNCIVLKTTTTIVYNSQYLVHPSSTSLI